jgi:DNA-binding CsgD family transcriptional regulator
MRIPLKLYQQLILYAIGLALMLLAMRWLEFKFIILNNEFEIYAGAIAIIFTGLGIWIALKLSKPKSDSYRVETKIIEKEIFKTNDQFVFNSVAFDELGISKREIEVLQLMANGLSNQEIADQLFVSLNTIKTHISRLFEKMEVKRRTQAIELAKKLSLIK